MAGRDNPGPLAVQPDKPADADVDLIDQQATSVIVKC